MSELIPEPNFIDRDPAALEAAMVAQFEAEAGRALHPAQVERILISVFAYFESLLRVAIQETGKQNLLAFARYPMLDYLGEIVGAIRLPATSAATTIRFTLTGVRSAPVVVPAGTRVRSNDGEQIFATDAQKVIPAGAMYGDAEATAAEAGAAGNGYVAGAITVLLDPVSFVATAANTTVSGGGADTEDDDAYRERIRQAPEQFSVAGSAGAYRFHALSVSSAIVDVTVTSPSMGVVRVYVLTSSGLPSAQLLSEIAAVLSADKVRPLTDTVEVVAPTEVQFQIAATVRPLVGADVPAVLEAVEAAAEEYAAELRAGLGQSIVPSQIISAISVPGVFEVTLTEPDLQELSVSEWANCTVITITEGAPGGG